MHPAAGAALDLANGIHYMESDDFEWDDAKAEANVRKHKINFLTASRVFDDPFVPIEQDVSEDYGEERFLATGLVDVADNRRLHRARRLHPHHFSAQGRTR
jgi:hypothetical protein